MDAAQDIDGTDATQLAGAMTVALPDAGPVATVPYVYARDHGFMVEGEADGAVGLVMREGANALGLLELRRVLGKPLVTRKVTAGEFEKLLAEIYAQDGAAQVVGDMGISGDGLDPLAMGLPTAEDLLDSADDAPAIRLINGLIAESLRQGVSDIHIEPYETALVVRMRVDGVLTEKLRMPPHVAPVLVSRI